MIDIHDLFYVKGNAFVPLGRVSSTARRGSKWFDAARVGDVVALRFTETNESFGAAIVVEKELTTYSDAIENAEHNHCAFNAIHGNLPAPTRLRKELADAYGSNLETNEVFSILHILPITGAKVGQLPRFPEAMKAVDSENEYQIDKLGEEGQIRTVDEWCLYIRDYAEEAAHQTTRGDEEAAVHTLRKVATMALVALEDNGAPRRPGY